MDDIVLRGMAKWPDVPAVFGWLALDRRGHWLLKGERIANPAIAAFFGRNYGCDAQGRWFFQNGPQRVYVTLEYTPQIYRLASPPQTPPQLVAHSGTAAATIKTTYIDDGGRLLLDTELGIGLLHDADLEHLLPRFCDAGGNALPDAALVARLETLQAGTDAGLWLDTGTARIPVQPIRATEVPARFGFIARPMQPAGAEECY